MYQKISDAYQSIDNRTKNIKNKKILILIAALLLTILFLTGYIGYRVQRQNRILKDNYYSKLIEDNYLNEKLTDFLQSQISTEEIKSHLKYLSSFAHLAATEGGKQSAEYVYQKWKKQGLENVQLIDYDVYLDYPDETKYNKIEIKDSDETNSKIYEIKERIFDEELNFTNITKPFLAYSPSGSVTSNKLFYVNHCDKQDFEFVLSKNITLNDSIVLCKYGWSFRANKVYNAEYYGAKAVLIFDDPSRSAPREAKDQIYPNGQFLPKDGNQRGTLNIKDGDPTTPLYPSNKYTYRLKEKDAELPKIISQVIGYGLAEELFSEISDEFSSPTSWKGDLNVSYSIGGSLKSEKKLTLSVFSQKRIEKIYNVIGVIKGSIEPDRYILVGNHRDAWTFGSVDPSSATSVLLEVSRSLSEMKKKFNWSPKRSIIFLSWDAEEYGLIGSTEWIEEFLNKLSANSVVYINCDNAIHGTFSYEAKASPQLHKLLFQITKNIKYNQNLSVFDRWKQNDPNEDGTEPRVNSNMGSGSDHANFLQRLGIPCIDQKFVRDKKETNFKNIVGSYPLYHTSYETYKLVEQYIDPDFFALTAIAKIISETSRVLSDSLILPFDIENYSVELNKQFEKFAYNFEKKLNNLNISLDNLKESIKNFEKNVIEFNKHLKNLDKSQYHLVRQFNDQMKNLEKSFLDVNYIKTGSMHTLYAPSPNNKYTGNSFPGIVRAIDKLDETANASGDEKEILIDNIRFNVAILINSIQSASHILKDPIDFTRF
ncbi:unnamed protein product [Brachionus calyciflorus]|uniref:N-acetylated-alpha-linked acidic dipeptidase 2 n=1 Tax=Brachionus calyciflorus TaxID=104777 RepID=A0A813XVZ5_9BILA|nr:unnamed protein product [Brachionus calyciflorus]